MKNILIIDDEYQVRDVINITLTENGYKAYEAENGKKGVELFMNINPDIVITDVNMPEMSGLELASRLMEHDPRREVVIMTGYSTHESAVQAIKLGASDYLRKPFTIHDFSAFKKSLKEILSFMRLEVLVEYLLSTFYEQ